MNLNMYGIKFLNMQTYQYLIYIHHMHKWWFILLSDSMLFFHYFWVILTLFELRILNKRVQTACHILVTLVYRFSMFPIILYNIFIMTLNVNGKFQTIQRYTNQQRNGSQCSVLMLLLYIYLFTYRTVLYR